MQYRTMKEYDAALHEAASAIVRHESTIAALNAKLAELGGDNIPPHRAAAADDVLVGLKQNSDWIKLHTATIDRLQAERATLQSQVDAMRATLATKEAHLAGVDWAAVTLADCSDQVKAVYVQQLQDEIAAVKRQIGEVN